MERIKNYLTLFAVLLSVLGSIAAQTGRSRSTTTRAGAAPDKTCSFSGTYRIDVLNSDRLYSVVKNVTSTVPFGDQQQFFMDLSTRLTPPDMLAMECRGQYVTVGSSRAERITYLADGKTRRERLQNGGFVNSRVTLADTSLTFVSTGQAEDNVNVAFESIDNGQRLSVTRRIYAKQLPDPVIIQTFYDKLSPVVDWTIYDRALVARGAAKDRTPAPRSQTTNGGDNIDGLRQDLASWLEATNRRDIDGQMRFYMPTMRAYYLTRNTPSRTVRLEKERVFRGVRSVDIRAGEPEIVFQNNGEIAVMRFVKDYRIVGGSGARRGAVIQELRWQHTPNGWRIFSERDVRVLR